jgi:hypothetical protein
MSRRAPPRSRARALGLLLGLVGCDPAFDGDARAPKAAHPPVAPAEDAAALDFAPAAFARLTTRQYRALLLELFGDTAPPHLQEDTYPYLFASVGASTEPLSESGVQLLEEAAAAVTAEVFADPARREALVGCAPTSADDPCVAAFLTDVGRRAYRRPLTATELARWTGVVRQLGAADPWTGLRSALSGILQSPYVVYRVELGEPHPTDPGLRVLTDWELATRLSLLLWDAPPDGALLDAAAAGRLSTPDGLAAEVDRLLADERAREATEAFFEQLLDLGRFDRATPDPATYPAFTPTLRAAMRAEVLLLVDDLVWRRDVDVRALFSEPRAFVNAELAAHYGVDAPGASAVAFVPVELPADGPRAGLLGLGAFLTMNAHAVDTSPTLRGKYVLERILCAEVPPPPGDVDLDLAAGGEEAATLRERLEQHREDPACAGCHALMDPPGFLFEHFDAVGAWRDTEGGQPIDDSGELLGVPLHGAAELGRLLAGHPGVGPCVVRQLFRHAHGRLDVEADEVALEQLAAGFAEDGHRFRPLLARVATHPSFRVIAVPAAEESP